MPAKPTPPPEPDPVPADTSPDTAAPAPTRPGAAPVPDPAAYAYTAGFETCYLEVPLTARPGTVFAWPDGAPADGRWQPTKHKPNQGPDNAPAASEED